MNSITCFIAYCNYAHDASNLRETLAALRQQTRPIQQIILCDQSLPADRAEIAAICVDHDVDYVQFPFTNYASAFGRMYNYCASVATGDLFMMLCSNWVLGPRWVQGMADWLEELGPRFLVACDNDRAYLKLPYDVCYIAPAPDWVDNPKLLLHRQDWVPMPEDWDPPVGYMGADRASGHALIWWGHCLVRSGITIMVRRDMEMRHGTVAHTPEYTAQLMQQHRFSDALLRTKLAGG